MLQNFLTTLFSTLGGAVGTVIILLTFGKQVVLKGLEVKLKQGADKNVQILILQTRSKDSCIPAFTG